jgi:Phytanoyl-CoA dioxygenase (PhyH)/SEC-C motif
VPLGGDVSVAGQPMDWTVAVSASELACGACVPDTEGAAHIAFHEHGCVLLRGAFPLATVEAMHGEYIAQCGWLDSAAMLHLAEKPAPNRFHRVGNARYEITLRMTGVFATAAVFGNGLLLKLLRPLLGHDIHLSSFTAVVSHPGATKQHAHRDHPHLYSDIGPTLPIYAITVAVPLVDIDLATGPTGVWLGSHKWKEDPKVLHAPTVCAVQRGDCMLMDYRTMHAGLANMSGRVRPILYLVYERPWFFDYGNHIRRIPLDMPLECYNQAPASLRPLLTRAYSYAMFTRWHESTAREPAREAHVMPPPAARVPADGWGKAGRNDPCPCGSGKRYKHCHGRIA